MKKLWKRGEAVGFRLLLLAFFLFCVYGTGVRRSAFYGEQKDTAIGWNTSEEPREIAGIGSDTVIKQVFYAQDGILNLIYIAVNGHGQTGNMIVTVYDDEDQAVAVRTIPCSQMVERGAQGVNVNVRVTPGGRYSYTITFEGVTDTYPVIQTASCLSEGELGSLYVDGAEQEQRIYGLFTYQAYYTQSFEWRVCVAVTLVILLYLIFYPLIPVWRTRLLPVFLAGHAVLGVYLVETATGNSLSALGTRRILYNSILCGLVLIALALVLWNGRVLLVTGTILCFVLGIAEYYVLEFRGSPLVLADLWSIRTAGEVSGAYRFDVTPQMFTAFLVMMTVFLLEHRVRFRRYSVKGHLSVLLALLLCGTGGFAYLRSRPILATGNNGGFFWDLSGSYQKYGYFLGTYIYENYQLVEKPEGYSPERVQELAGQMEQIRQDREQDEAGYPKQQALPNIIVVMNESFTDFASVGGITTSAPVTPFLDSLSENTIKGNLYVSVFGGGTANTEFEFLTGNTMKFLPRGSTPYQAYVKKALPSLASYLKEYGYTSTVLHLANRTNWNRDRVYPLLGFDTYWSEEDGGELDCIHGYPSDQENYRVLLERYEAWKKTKETEHFFCFNVTIQNHGGYLSGYRSADAPQYTGGKTSEDVEEYLSLLRESDRAFEELVAYFEKAEEPTVILMFGDHWPRLNNSFINAMANQADAENALEKNQNKYVTPFVIWANYDIEEAQIEKLSANYLSVLLLKTAGIPLDEYQTFLDELSKRVPVINSLGYVDDSGAYFESGEETDAETADWILDAERLQYAHLFGNGESASFFSGAN